MNKDFEIITIPMFAIHEIEETGIFDKKNIGDVFYYDQDSIFHRELFDAGFLEDIPNRDCTFICNELKLQHDGETLSYGDTIDLSEVDDILINRLVLSGTVKKIYNPGVETEIKETNKISKEKTKKVKKNSYAKIAKKLNLKPKQFQGIYFEKFNKEIKDMKHTVSKPTEKKIIEALSK